MQMTSLSLPRKMTLCLGNYTMNIRINEIVDCMTDHNIDHIILILIISYSFLIFITRFIAIFITYIMN